MPGRASMPLRAKHSLCVTALLVIMVTLLQMAPAFAQEADEVSAARIVREGRQLPKSEVEQLESALNDHPDDVATRTKLLGFLTENCCGGAAHLCAPVAQCAPAPIKRATEHSARRRVP